MIMWVMSDRAIPRSFRMMEGFGVHTFRLVNAKGDVALRQVPLEAAARRALAGLGRGAEDRRQGPRLPPARPVGGDRDRRLPGVGARPADHRGGATSTTSTSTCSTRPSSCPRSSCRCERVGRLTLDRNPDNFFAETEQVAFHPGHVVPGHRLHQRPAAAGPPVLLHRHAAHPPGRAQLPRDPDQPAGRAGAQQPARRLHAPDRSTPASVAYQPELARRRLPDAGGRATGRLRQLSAERSRAPKVRERSREVLRPLQPGDPVLEQPVRAREGAHRRRPSGSSSARSSGRDPRADGGHAGPGGPRSGRPGGGGSGPRGAREAGRPAQPERARRRGPQEFQPIRIKQKIARSTALSMADTVKDTIKTRKVAILAADGVDEREVAASCAP